MDIRSFRQRHQLTLKMLSRLSHIPYSTLRDMENNRYKTSKREDEIKSFMQDYIKRRNYLGIYKENQDIWEDISQCFEAVDEVIKQKYESQQNFWFKTLSWIKKIFK